MSGIDWKTGRFMQNVTTFVQSLEISESVVGGEVFAVVRQIEQF
jgi:Na+/glutamate symporter